MALICFAVPGLQIVFAGSLQTGLAYPGPYALAFGLLFIILNAYAWYIDRAWSVSKLAWIAYLGALSFWEEWVFRVAFPHTLEGYGASIWLATILSAAVFGGAHYFTLRWKWHWCVGAFLGSLALSRQFHAQNDLLFITGLHWAATCINTPRPPGETARITHRSTRSASG